MKIEFKYHTYDGFDSVTENGWTGFTIQPYRVVSKYPEKEFDSFYNARQYYNELDCSAVFFWGMEILEGKTRLK